MSRPKPVVLCILDGWGHSDHHDHNAIELAQKPNWEQFTQTCPNVLIDASELHVGLPQGQMGNSEVGHMNLGAGRVVMQDLPRIDQSIKDHMLEKEPKLLEFIQQLKASKGDCHLLGLLSPGGVHSHQNHILALAGIIAKEGIKVYLHAFLDGRDTPPQSAKTYVREIEAKLPKEVTWATIGGRYYAMDRDKRWDRVERAYDAMMGIVGENVASPLLAIEESYSQGITDEFIHPTIMVGFNGMKDGDGVLMANFRADRAREILLALLDPYFASFPRKRIVNFAAALGMTEYSEELNPLMKAIFPSAELKNTLGEVIAKAGLKQLRIAETEKYAHVTFFFNGGEEKILPGEERILVPSPKVATYDLQPEMSAFEVTDQLVGAIESRQFDLIVVNYANTDMVGHSGELKPAIKAVEVVDQCLGRIADAVKKEGGILLITADHGNAETMQDPETGEKHTAHTLNLVPFILISAGTNRAIARGGRLADVAPTILALMDLPQPKEMTGHSLLI